MVCLFTRWKTFSASMVLLAYMAFSFSCLFHLSQYELDLATLGVGFWFILHNSITELGSLDL